MKQVKRMMDKAWKLMLFVSEFFRDMLTFIRHNGYSPLESRNKKLFYKILIETHTVEKGLSLKEPKPLFGKDKINGIIRMLNDYDRTYSALPLEMALGAFQGYLDLHRTLGISDDFVFYLEAYVEHLKRDGTPGTGGIKHAAPWPGSGGADAKAFLQSRSSCRMFQAGKIDRGLLTSLVELAQSSPSQCNRQSSRVHVYQDRAVIAQLLELQGGSRGFAQSVDNLFVVTSEVTAWGGAGQRNQLYVDGALFSMGLLLACHANGLGACPLNLAILNSVEKKIRSIGAIPASERLIMMIAVGLPLESHFRAARSPRRLCSEVLQLHGA
ncbi:nitroreductase [Pseudomonas lurida]|jgi:nitroreductase|nr:nitroreductase [Pseudomonas lurida]